MGIRRGWQVCRSGRDRHCNIFRTVHLRIHCSNVSSRILPCIAELIWISGSQHSIGFPGFPEHPSDSAGSSKDHISTRDMICALKWPCDIKFKRASYPVCSTHFSALPAFSRELLSDISLHDDSNAVVGRHISCLFTFAPFQNTSLSSRVNIAFK